MTGDRRTPPHDPTAERTADQSTQSAAGLHQGVDGPKQGGDAGGAREGGDTDYRNDEDLYAAPRRSEPNGQADTDTVMPSADASLNTKT